MLLPNFVDMEMKLSLHINDDLQKTVITNVMTLVCHNNVRSIIMKTSFDFPLNETSLNI